MLSPTVGMAPHCKSQKIGEIVAILKGFVHVKTLFA